MVFRRQALRLRPVKSYKHVRDQQGGLAIGTTTSVTLADTVDAPVLANPAEVETACTIHSIYLDVQIAATTSGALSNVYMIVYKNPGNNLTMPEGNAVGISDNKRHILHQEMLMLQRSTLGIPRSLFKGVIKLPRSIKRFGVDDQLSCDLLAPGTTMDFCVQCIYKEFR